MMYEGAVYTQEHLEELRQCMTLHNFPHASHALTVRHTRPDAQLVVNRSEDIAPPPYSCTQPILHEYTPLQSNSHAEDGRAKQTSNPKIESYVNMVLGDDYEVKRTTWESKVPVEFVLDDASAVTRRRDHSSFVMLPRISYFPLHLSKVLGRLLSNTQTNDDSGSEDVGSDAWLQFNGAPLKWHYPIGVLYDMFVNGNVDEQPPLPWLLTIKLKKFPDELIRCRSKEGMRNVFIQSVKEADHLKHRGSIVQSMTADEHSRLFNSILNAQLKGF
uniref:Autophagy protein 5 n=1 Tax=Ditylenchus dipsaci TaxID=166011 RepID=A0A915E5D9_9BILA